jgi:hypothetical protein
VDASRPSRPRAMPTRCSPVGGRALSRRQPLIPVSHRSRPQGQLFRMKSAKWCEVSRACGMCPTFAVVAEVVRQGLVRCAPSWLRLRGGHRAQPKVAKAMAGEATLREVPKAQADRGFSGPSGPRAMEGISDRGSSARSRGVEWSRSRLVARRGSLRNGGRRAGRPATRCQRSRTGRTGFGRKRRTVRPSADRSGRVSCKHASHRAIQGNQSQPASRRESSGAGL